MAWLYFWPSCTFAPACLLDAAAYDVVLTDLCGTVVAGPALVGVESASDLNRDGAVNGADLGLLVAAWGSANQIADIDGSGEVDGADLGLLLCDWVGD